MVAVALLLVTNSGHLLRELAQGTNAPSFLFNPTKAIETSGAGLGRSELDQRRTWDRQPPRHYRGKRSPDRPALDPCRCSAAPPTSPEPSAGFNTPGGPPPVIEGIARQVRPGRLLDLHLHQLHPHPALHRGLVPALPPRRARDRRRATPPSSRSRKEAGNVQDAIKTDGITYPVVAGQRLRHLERVRQPVLAGRLPDRCPGQGPRRPFRRGPVRQERAGDSLAAGRARQGFALAVT